jgi:hypothetical protein
MYRVTLKPGHPKGVYHRSGRAFTAEPVYLSEEEMTRAIRDDTIWLNVEEVGEEEGLDWPTGAAELIEHINGLDDHDSVQAILDWEQAGKDRVTIIQAAEDRLNALDVHVDPEGAEPAEAADEVAGGLGA